MKLRNQLLALFCMLAFAAAGYLYVQKWVVQKPFGIILFVSDGLVARQLTMARLFEDGADHRLALESFPNVALLRNPANDFAVPDNAAAATALATGYRGNHRALSVDVNGQALESIAALARKGGRAFGLVSNGSLCNPVPAAFYAHTPDCREEDALAVQLAEQFRPDVALGGGANSFLPGTGEAGQPGARPDGRNLLLELSASGVEIVHTNVELEKLAPYQSTAVLGLFAPHALAYSSQVAAGSQPSLADMVRRSISFLQQRPKGYLLVVDAALVGTAAESNEAERMISETIALDHAVSTAVKYAGGKSLILAVGKHSTGGLNLNGYPPRQDHGVALLGANAAGYPYLTWATGPNGPASGNSASLVPPSSPTPAGSNPRNEPAAFQSPSAMNNAEDVLAIGMGRGSEGIKGFLDNTAIFELLKNAL